MSRLIAVPHIVTPSAAFVRHVESTRRRPSSSRAAATMRRRIAGQSRVMSPGLLNSFLGAPAGTGPFYRSITIDHTKCGTADSTDIPVLFYGTYSYLKSAANGGKVKNTSGGLPCDLTFSSDSAGLSLYKFQIVSWDATTGAIEAWIKIPTLSHTSDTVFYLRYGDSSIVTYQGDNVNTWNTAYKGVWHLDGSASPINMGDASGNGQVLTNASVTATSGQIGIAAAFNGSASLTRSPASLASTSAWTLQAWIDITGGSSFRSVALLGDGATRTMHIDVDGTPKARAVLTQGTSNYKVATGATTLSSSTWYLLHGRYNGSALQIFVNGASDASTAVTGTADSTTAWAIGSLSTANFTGNIDEVRVSNVARSDSWILAEYNNQSSPSTFYTVGPET